MSGLELTGVFVGTFFLVTGIFFFILASKKVVDNSEKYNILGAFFILFGLCILGFIIYKNMQSNDTQDD
jgi:divalent metal cation (Fe/Co/Zn/Cd) transporter